MKQIPAGLWVKAVPDADGDPQLNDLGPGKVLEHRKDSIIVEYFDSPGREDRPWREHRRVVRFEPHRETRVHYRDPKTSNWAAGRLQVEVPNGWAVIFPNKVRRELPEEHLHIRWNRRIEDPIYNLAARVCETHFFHEHRSKFIASAVAQRAWSSGMTGLISSQIELEPHQIEVVRRVLQDPIQRYLLADEVGLGKTIEAGVIIRQDFLDNPASVGVIVVPPQLVSQWREELTKKFLLDPYLDKSLFVLESTDTSKLEQALRMNPGIVVIDEAHHVGVVASQRHGEGARQYRAVEALARHSPKLLLLSATPVLRNEWGFLGMLQLLDPDVHRIDDIDAFRARVAHRQGLADALGQFTVDQEGIFLEQVLDQFERLFPGDHRLRELCSALRPLVDESAEHPPRNRLVRSIRTHVSETYRLHHRILRNRRTERLAGLLPGRAGLEPLRYQDPAEETIEDILDTWRVELARHPSPQRAHGELYAVLAEAQYAPAVLRGMIRGRLTAETVRDVDVVLWPGQKAALTSPLFPGEHALLVALLAAVERSTAAPDSPRAEVIADKIVSLLDPAPNARIVVFVDHEATKLSLGDYLRRRIGPKKVRLHLPGTGSGSSWDPQSEVRVLVCDRRAEEGLNLQGGETYAIHYDLPFSPNRIEQRLGRLDRFGSGRKVKSFVPVRGGAEISLAWTTILAQGFRVFERSIASLQYVIEERMKALKCLMVEAGAGSLDATAADISAELEKELRAIRAQEVLDSMETPQSTDASGASMFERLEDGDSDWAAIEDAFRGWAFRTLGFEQARDPDPNVFRLRYTDQTLIPVNEFLTRFKDSVDTRAPGFTPTRPVSSRMCFKRISAVKSLAHNIRIGESFYDGLVQQAMTDDRGTCFALWRCVAGDRFEDVMSVLKFTFILDGSMAAFDGMFRGRATVERMSARRQLDARFPPRVRTVWMAENGEEVQDAGILELLNAPFSNRPKDRRVDHNIDNSRWEYIETLISGSKWHRLCLELRRKAESILVESLDVARQSAAAAKQAEEEFSSSIEQLQLRLAVAEGDRRTQYEQEIARQKMLAETLLAGVWKPSIVLDSTGVIFLANSDPFGPNS